MSRDGIDRFVLREVYDFSNWQFTSVVFSILDSQVPQLGGGVVILPSLFLLYWFYFVLI
jgi:hypothetical protein